MLNQLIVLLYCLTLVSSSFSSAYKGLGKMVAIYPPWKESDGYVGGVNASTYKGLGKMVAIYPTWKESDGYVSDPGASTYKLGKGKMLSIYPQWKESDGIVGDEYATITQAPWQAWMVLDDKFDDNGGGAVLIHKSAALTVAHCCDRIGDYQVIIRYGGIDRTNLHHVANVSRVIKHPNWSPNNIDSDYCVLILADEVHVGLYVKLIDLADKSPAVGEAAELTGWDWYSGKLPTKLKHARLEIADKLKCQEKIGYKFTSNMICAENKTTTFGLGDSGGPLVVNNKLAGLESFGCDGSNNATSFYIYSDVAEAKNWILEQLQKYANDF